MPIGRFLIPEGSVHTWHYMKILELLVIGLSGFKQLELGVYQ